MAPPIKVRWIVYLFLAGLVVFLFNKVIVTHYFDDIQRAKVLRFQLSCLIQFATFLGSLFVWSQMSSRFDQKLNISSSSYLKDSTSVRRFFNLQNIAGRRFSLISNVWRVILLTILVSTQLVYSTFTFFITNAPYPHAVAMWFFLCLACFVQLITGIVIDKILTFLAKVCFKWNNAIKSIFKNNQLKGIVIIVYAFTVVSVGHYNTLLPPEIKEVTVPVKDLPSKMNHMTITFVSDIHLGPTVGRQRLEQVVHMVNYLNSDVVVIGGDLVDGRVDQLGESVESLRWIKSKYGTYFVTGNHEYYTTDAHTWVKHLESMGVHVLQNTGVDLSASTEDDGKICLAGVNDPTADLYRFMDHTMDVNKALRSCDQRYPVVLVSHQPKGAKEAMGSSYRVDLALSGHTHGGQMFPIIIGAYLFNPYYAGLYPHGDHRYVYVSMGTLYWGMPVRFGTTSEITKVILVTAE